MVDRYFSFCFAAFLPSGLTDGSPSSATIIGETGGIVAEPGVELAAIFYFLLPVFFAHPTSCRLVIHLGLSLRMFQ
jgi:hypothetical protein